MKLRYFDNSWEARDNDEDYIYYDLACSKCNSEYLVDIDYSYEYIDGNCFNTFTIECQNCGNVWKESDIDLTIESY